MASQAEQVFYTPYPCVNNETKDIWAVVKTKPRGVYEGIEPEAKVADDENIEADGLFQIDERFELPNDVTSESLCLTHTNPTGEDEEFEVEEYTSDEADEMDFSDHDSDENELDC